MTGLSTAAGGDEEILELEPVPETPSGPGFWTPRHVRILFLSLAGVAAIALAVAIMAIVLAPPSTVTILVVALIVLALVVVAEIVILLVAKPQQA